MLVRPVAYALPIVETAVAVALLIPMSRGYAGWSAALLLVVFTLAVAINLFRGRREIDCGCFSSELKQRLSWWLVVRNVVLGGLALWCGARDFGVHPASGAEWLLGVGAAVTVATIYAGAASLSGASQLAAANRASVNQQ